MFMLYIIHRIQCKSNFKFSILLFNQLGPYLSLVLLFALFFKSGLTIFFSLHKMSYKTWDATCLFVFPGFKSQNSIKGPTCTGTT